MSARRAAPPPTLTDAADPATVGRNLVRSLAAIICRCVHAQLAAHPCDACARFGRSHGPALGRLLFAWVQGAPYGDRQPTQAEYDEVGRLLEQLDQVAAGQLPRFRTPKGDGL